MEVTDAIRNRKSTRAFLDKPVSEELISDILECARWAPSGVNSQPWHVAIVTGETKLKVGKALPTFSLVSPVTIATCQGCELTPDGAQRAHSRISLMSSSETGLSKNARVDFRFLIASVTSIDYPNSRRRGFRGKSSRIPNGSQWIVIPVG